MQKMIAFCGLNCAQCEEYLATLANDRHAKKLIAKKWQEEFKLAHVDPDSVNCDGCTEMDMRLSPFCLQCRVRACALARKVRNCAFCEMHPDCATLRDFFDHEPFAKASFEAYISSLKE